MHTTFDWRLLGNPDYSQAHALVASLPEENRKCLSGVSHELLCRILHLSWIFAKKSGRGSAYCWPTLKTLAAYLHRSERTVERHLCKLRDAGLISYRNRTTSSGAWTSNLYQMGKTFMAALFARTKKKVQSFRAPTKVSDNDLKREYKASAPSQRGERLTDFLAKHRAEQKPPLGEATFDGAPDNWNTEEVVNDRKAELKRQAARLIAAETEGEW